STGDNLARRISVVPRCQPDPPRLNGGAEHAVFKRLSDQLGASDVLITGQRLSDDEKDFEADFVLLVPDAGVVVVEVKGGSVWRTAAGEWHQASAGGSGHRIDPVRQALECHYKL